MFDWGDLRIFLAVAREGSTLSAAKALGVNQTTIARRIGTLEEATGLRLFDRRQDGYRLCEAGQALMAPALAVESAVSDVEYAVGQQRRGLAGAVSITTTEAIAVSVLTPWVADFMDLYPDIRVEMIASERRLDLAAGEADLAIRAQKQPEGSGVVSRKIAHSTWSVYCSAGYAERRGAPRSLDELGAHAVIGYDGPLAQLDLCRWFQDAAPPASIRSKCISIINMYAAVRAGQGVGLLPCAEALNEPTLVECFAAPDFGYGLFLVTNAAVKDLPRVRALSDFIVARSVSMRRQLEGEQRAPRLVLDGLDPGL
jgi:DNA-binding transcriptional LysR family regulator